LTTVAGLTGEVALAREAVAGRLRGVDPADFAAVRRAYDAFAENDPLPAGAAQSVIPLAGVRCLGVLPKGVGGDQVIFWLHGGGFAMGSSISHRAMAGWTAEHASAAAVIPDYRLAPEHPFPAAIDDAVDAYKAMLGEGVAPGRIIVAGDSAGGWLATALLLRLRAEGIASPAGLMLLSPWVNLANTGWSWEAKATRDPFITKPGLDATAKRWLGERSPLDPEISLLDADLRGFPPVYIQVGEAETLLSDSTRLAERLGASGSPVTLEIWPDMFHVFQARFTLLSPARQAIERLGAWTKAHLRGA
jgi:monoterpene epsilon-lactone hydrolase